MKSVVIVNSFCVDITEAVGLATAAITTEFTLCNVILILYLNVDSLLRKSQVIS